MLDRHDGHGKKHGRHHRHRDRRHRHAMDRPDDAAEQDGEVRLVLLALIATGLRDGRLRLQRPANGRGVDVLAADPSATNLLPPPDLAAAADANARLLLAAPPRGRRHRRGGSAGPLRVTPISRR